MGFGGEGGKEGGEGGESGSVEKHYSVSKQDKSFALMPETLKTQASSGRRGHHITGGGSLYQSPVSNVSSPLCRAR